MPIAWTATVVLGMANAALAVHPLSSHGATPEAMRQLDAAVRLEAASLPGVTVVPEPAVGSALPSPCGSDLACLVRFGRAARAGEVLFGEVRVLPDSFAVSLHILDVGRGLVTASASANVNRDVEDMVWATRAQVARLTAPSRYAGRVVFELPPGARAEIDGVPADGPRVLPPGVKAIRVAAEGESVDGWIEVRYAHSTLVSLAGGALSVRHLPWNPAAPGGPPLVAPPAASQSAPVWLQPASPRTVEPAQEPSRLAPWPGYAAVVAGAALAVTGAVQHLRARSLRAEIEDLRLGSGAFPPERAGEVRQKASSYHAIQQSGWWLLGVGAAAAVGGGVYLMLGLSPASASMALATTL